MSSTAPIVTNAAPPVEVLANLYLEAGFVRDADLPKLRRAIDGTSRWWVASECDHIVGIARCLTDWARYACIYDVIVRRSRQGEGIGTALMHAVLRDLVAADVDTVHLWPSVGKAGFYERLGFVALSHDQPLMKFDRTRAADDDGPLPCPPSI